MMDRKEELLKLIENDISLTYLVDEMLFMEEKMEKLKELPFIRTNPKNPYQQRTTPAHKQYKELLQQYTNVVRILLRVTGKDGEADESPLREWVKGHINTDKQNMDTG